jgi:hypothetical protein
MHAEGGRLERIAKLAKQAPEMAFRSLAHCINMEWLREAYRRTPSRTEPGTFDLLGFMHFWGVARSGKWIAKRNTAKDRFRKALKPLADWCSAHLHDPVVTPWRTLGGTLRGHVAYYGIVGNFRAIARFREEARRVWKKWLNRRSQRVLIRSRCLDPLLLLLLLPLPLLNPIAIHGDFADCRGGSAPSRT